MALQKAAQKHADLANALAMWRTAVAAAKWTNLAQLKADFPSADYVPPFTVFNVRGNRYRLITSIDYEEHVVVVRNVLTHAIYSRGKWK
jgi:mRNA interferase HigB